MPLRVIYKHWGSSWQAWHSRFCGIILHKNNTTSAMKYLKDTRQRADKKQSHSKMTASVSSTHLYDHSFKHTHMHVTICHFHRAAALVLFWLQIRFAVMRDSWWTWVKSAESSLVTVQQPWHHLHSTIWMFSGSVAGDYTSLHNSRWLSQIMSVQHRGSSELRHTHTHSCQITQSPSKAHLLKFRL